MPDRSLTCSRAVACPMPSQTAWFHRLEKDWLSCNPHPLSLLGPSTGRDQPLLLKPSVRVPRSYSLQFRILYFVLYWRLIRLDFPAAMTLPPKSP